MHRLAGAVAVFCVFCWCVYFGGTVHAQNKTRPRSSHAARDAIQFFYAGSPRQVQWRSGVIVVGVYPRTNEGYLELCVRVIGVPGHANKVARFNAKKPLWKERAVWFLLGWLPLKQQGYALRALHRDDSLSEKGWVHTVTHPQENLSQLAEAYAGDVGRVASLAKLNGITDPNVLPRGKQIYFPLKWLQAGLQLTPTRLKKPLRFVRGRQGRHFALYTLRQGDTLYSTVVRFTDRERASEINRLAHLLAKANGFRSLHRVIAGRDVLIPLEWVSDEHDASGFLGLGAAVPPPKKTVRTVKPSAAIMRKPAKVPLKQVGRRLYVILDPGHGGIDPGAVYENPRVIEHEVVYDIALRMKILLIRKRAAVYMTLYDPKQKKPLKNIARAHLGAERIAVHPAYILHSANVGVNMRVYLINALYRKLRKQGVAKEKIILLSLHGDALAPSLRGVMFYFPDYRLRHKEFAPQNGPYHLRKEAIPGIIRFDYAKNQEAHRLSRRFALHMAAALRKEGQVVSNRKPVRSFYYRQGEQTLPAVLRYSRVPFSLLVEVANLNNPQDRRAMLQAGTRQRIAQALVKGLLQYPSRKRL